MRTKPVILVALLLASFLVNLDTTIVNVGGTLGAAVIGSVYASVYASRLTATIPPSVPAPVAAIAHQSVGAAYAAAGQIAALGHPALGQALHHASTSAFSALAAAAWFESVRTAVR